MKDIDIVTFLFIVLAGLITYFAGLYVPVLEIDSAQYASISREMMESGNFLQVQHRLVDYLDKPPLLFWLSSVSMNIFGANDFAFKLPSLLFSFLGFYSTYRLGTRLYNRFVGLNAFVILFSTQAIFLFNQDVRTDTILTGAVIFSIWQLVEYLESKKIINMVLGFIGISFAMLAKGPIGLMVPILAIGSHLVLKKKYRDILNPIWLIGILIILIILSPMTYGLYQQFGWEGVRFFYWTQSFGRLTGENVWRNDTGFFFFFHTYLWAFLPFTFLGIIALLKHFKLLIHYLRKRITNIEIITLAGFVLPFLALSLSKYKLPHYIFVMFPLLAIMSAFYIDTLINKYNIKRFRLMKSLNYLIFVIVWSICFVSIFWFFPTDSIVLYLIIILLFALSAYLLFRKYQILNQFVYSLAVSSIALNFALNIQVFPELLQYQSGIQAAEIYNVEKSENDRIIGYKSHSHAFDFYSQNIVINHTKLDSIKNHIDYNTWIYTNEESYEELKPLLNTKHKKYELLHFHVALLNLKFLNPATRESKLKRRYLIKN